MKTTLTIAAASALMMLASTSANAQMAGMKQIETTAGVSASLIHKTGKRSRRRGRVAAGIALGVLGAAAAAHAHQHNYYRGSRYERQCRRWRRWCRNGDDRSCWRYDDRC